MWKHPFPTETALPLEPSEKIFCDAEISGCSRCRCYPVVPPLHLLRTTRPGSSSTLRSRRSLRSLARCAATKRFSNILKINEKSINITTKTWKTSSEERLGRAKLEPQQFFNVSGKLCGTILGRFWQAEMRSRRRQDCPKWRQDGTRRYKTTQDDVYTAQDGPKRLFQEAQKGDR